MGDIKLRDSNFEMLRIISMFCIILYHIIFFFCARIQPESVFWQSIQYPLHIGVIVFVLISGYYGITVKKKGVIHLLLLTFLYFTPLCVIGYFTKNDGGLLYPNGLGGGRNIFLWFLPFSKGPYWFIRTYLWLYLLSPMINSYIRDKSNNLKYIILITGGISIYMGLAEMLVDFEPSRDNYLSQGKSIINFIFIYCIGRYIKQNEGYFSRFKLKHLIIVYIIMNTTLVWMGAAFHGSVIETILYYLFFSYNSIGLLFNSLILFLIFGKLNFKSRGVNLIAGSTFSMYLFHHNPFILYSCLQPIVLLVLGQGFGITLSFSLMVLLTLVIMLVTFVIDYALKPIVRFTENILDRVIRIGFVNC